MLKKHKNALLQVCRNSDIPFAQFQREETKDDCFIIRIRNTPLEFWVLPSGHSLNRFGLRFNRFASGFPLVEPSKRGENIGQVTTKLAHWLHTTAKPYLEDNKTPDPWAQLENYGTLITTTTISEQDLGYFSAEEKEHVQQSLLEFRTNVVENFNPTPEQQEFVDERLDYLRTAVDRLNRFDWKGLAISIGTSIAINLAVDTETGRQLFQLFQQAFQSLTKLLI